MVSPGEGSCGPIRGITRAAPVDGLGHSIKRDQADRRTLRALLIAQITDIHLGFDAGNPIEFNRTRLDAVLREIAAARPGPDILVATGDLTEAGVVEDYRPLRELLGELPGPGAADDGQP